MRTAKLTGGGGAAPVHGLPLDCGRAAGGTEVIRDVAGRLSRREFRRTIRDGRRRGRARAWVFFGFWAGGGRVNLRYSGTEPLVRIMAEGEDAAAVTQAIDIIADAIAVLDR